MEDYISRADAVRAIEAVPDGNWKSIRYSKEIKAIPAADAVPVKHGEWIRCGDGENTPYLCSHCGKTVPAILIENWVGVKYCPMCGALMDKDGDVE